VGIMIAGMFRSLVTTIIGGASLGMAVSAMHTQLVAISVIEGVVAGTASYLIALWCLRSFFDRFALYCGSVFCAPQWPCKWAGVLTLSSVSALQFHRRAAFNVDCIGLKPATPTRRI